MIRWALALLCCGAAAAAFACGDDDEPDPRNEAAQAAALFFQQEAAAGVLPEGNLVESRGSRGVVVLEPNDAASTRVCVEYQYIRAEPPFESHVRVYVASLTDDDTWQVEPVNPDGTCEGVA